MSRRTEWEEAGKVKRGRAGVSERESGSERQRERHGEGETERE